MSGDAVPGKEQINHIMSALLQEIEDIQKRAEQQCILNEQWQELVAIQHKRTELLNVAAFLSSLAGFEQNSSCLCVERCSARLHG